MTIKEKIKFLCHATREGHSNQEIASLFGVIGYKESIIFITDFLDEATEVPAEIVQKMEELADLNREYWVD